MPDPLPPITPAQRQRLQKLWEEARGLMVREGVPSAFKDAERIHELLAECVIADPGNTVYLDAFLVNLRRLRQGRGFSFWSLIGLPGEAEKAFLVAWHNTDENEALRRGPAALREATNHSYAAELIMLARSCAASDFPQAELRYLQEVHYVMPAFPSLHLRMASSLMRQGRFDECRMALACVNATDKGYRHVCKMISILDGPSDSMQESAALLLPSLQKTTESLSATANDYINLASTLAVLNRFDEAEIAAAKAQSLSGGDLSVREKSEELALARLRNQVAISRRLLEHYPFPANEQILRRWEEELGRLELATLHTRSERFPQDAGLKLEVAVRLKRAGNYSGAIQRLEEIAADHSRRPSVLVELGECWQHLKQFDKALDFYTQAIAAAEEREPQDALHLALYRAGFLAAAMQRTADAKAAFQRLVNLAPDFKDARQRLLVLDT